MIDQQTATVAIQAAQQSNEMISSQLGGAMLLAYLLQWAKNSKLIPFVTHHTKVINYALTGAMSLIAAVGIHYTFDPNTGAFAITGTVAGLVHGTWEWAKQWAFQQASATMITTKSIAESVQQGAAEPPTGIARAEDK